MITEVAERVSVIRARLGLTATGAVAGSSGSEFAASLASAMGGASAGVTGAAVVAGAKRYLGVPYVFGGTNPATGLDCSGLVQRVYKDLGIDLPRIAADQARAGRPVPNLSQARPGDLLAFGSPVDHIAIYVGDGKMIAAPQPGEKVKIQNVYTTPTAIRRVVPEPTAGPYGASAASSVRPSALMDASGVPYASLFRQVGARYGMSPSLLAAVAQVESNFKPNAVSHAGAQGLMQLMPTTAASLGVNPLDPAQAVDGAARLLSKHLRDFGSLPLALAAYNAGPGAVRQYGGIPPYAETQAYVPKVQNAMAQFQAKGFG